MKRKRDTVDIPSALRSSVKALTIGTSSQTSDLVCRDEQIKDIIDFLDDDVNNTMQLFGMPGTGKTATIHHALSQLASSRKTKPTAVFLNGYVVQKSTDIFWTLNLHLMKARKGETAVLKPEQCAANIEKHFRQGWGYNPSLCVIVIDEVDKIVKGHSKALFKLIDWLSLPHAKCKLIAISNSMELAVDAKTKSRLDITKRLVFRPYSVGELRKIIDCRLSHIDIKIFSDQALNLLCYQTATHYGDVRRLLQCAASAVCSFMMSPGSNTPSPETGLITVREIHSVIRHIFHDGFIEYIKTMNSPILFSIVCVIAKGSFEGLMKASESRLSLSVLYRQIQALPNKNVSSIPKVYLYGAIVTFKQVSLIDVSIGRDCEPVVTLEELIENGEDAFVSLLQPVQAVVDACRLHEKLSEYSKSIL